MIPTQARLLVLTAVAVGCSAQAFAFAPTRPEPQPVPTQTTVPVPPPAPPATTVIFDNNVPQDLRTQVLNDLTFIGTLTGSAETVLHNQIFGRVAGQSYKTFFESRVAKAGVQGCGNPNAVACVQPNFFGRTDKIWFTTNYTRFAHPSIARLMVIFHEARHTEDNNRNWGHATCPTPFRNERGEDMRSIFTGALLAGEPACDVSPMGSYGSSTIMLKNIGAYCSNCTEKVKHDAALYSTDQLGRITNANAKNQMINDPVAPRSNGSEAETRL